MIVGNVAAFGGTLLNPEFRQHWWPLAGLHVALNIGLLAMELAGPRRARGLGIGSGLAVAGILAGAVVAALDFDKEAALAITLPAVATVACGGGAVSLLCGPEETRRTP